MAGSRVLVYVLLVYAVVLVWGLDVVHVKLGQNATINCSGNQTSTYWHLEDQENFTVRTFSQDPSDTVTVDQTKYVAAGNVLVVTNITANDTRMYSCGKKKSGAISTLDRILLVPDCPDRCSSGSQVDPRRSESSTWPWRTDVVLLSSLSLNAVLIVVLIGLVCGLGLRRNPQVVQTSPWIPDPPETLAMPQYEEIQIRPHVPAGPGSGPAGPGSGPAGPGPAGPDCFYYKLQLPEANGTRTRTLDLDS